MAAQLSRLRERDRLDGTLIGEPNRVEVFSGAPLSPKAARTVAYLALLLAGRVPIIGAGGVLEAQQGRVMLQNGELLR